VIRQRIDEMRKQFKDDRIVINRKNFHLSSPTKY
jgi:hypothetical protein